MGKETVQANVFLLDMWFKIILLVLLAWFVGCIYVYTQDAHTTFIQAQEALQRLQEAQQQLQALQHSIYR